MKLFISQPMRNKSDEEILKERNQIISEVECMNFEKIEVLESFLQSAPHEAKPLCFLGKSLEVLSNADIAYFAEGWKEARSCKIEHQCCLDYGIKIIKD